MKTQEFKSDNQLTIELLERNDVKEIKNHLTLIYSKTDYTVKGSHSGAFVDINNIGDTLLELVEANANDFTKDIAAKSVKNQWNLSEKQAWCVAYQIHNNIEAYKIAMAEYFEKAKELYGKDEEEFCKE